MFGQATTFCLKSTGQCWDHQRCPCCQDCAALSAGGCQLMREEVLKYLLLGHALTNWWPFICKVTLTVLLHSWNCRVQHRLSGVASLIDDLDGSGKKHYQHFLTPVVHIWAGGVHTPGTEIVAIQLHRLSSWMPSGAPDEWSAQPLEGNNETQLKGTEVINIGAGSIRIVWRCWHPLAKEFSDLATNARWLPATAEACCCVQILRGGGACMSNQASPYLGLTIATSSLVPAHIWRPAVEIMGDWEKDWHQDIQAIYCQWLYLGILSRGVDGFGGKGHIVGFGLQINPNSSTAFSKLILSYIIGATRNFVKEMIYCCAWIESQNCFEQEGGWVGGQQHIKTNPSRIRWITTYKYTCNFLNLSIDWYV